MEKREIEYLNGDENGNIRHGTFRECSRIAIASSVFGAVLSLLNGIMNLTHDNITLGIKDIVIAVLFGTGALIMANNNRMFRCLWRVMMLYKELKEKTEQDDNENQPQQ